ncbi:hypothetical protein PM082_021245 [Marasmius tenuissimus]|nr:hypothetical protein PM082_021245 [Marasmius tenuissimus]
MPTPATLGLPEPHVQLPNQLSTRQRIFFIAYILVMVSCLTFALASNALFGQQLWIDHKDFKGGPSAYWDHMASSWFNVTGSAMCMFVNCMGDLLSLYRCYIIWASNRIVVIIPGLFFLASTAMAIISLIQSASPGSSLFVGTSLRFYVPWIVLTCSLNVIVTTLIIYRLVSTRLQVRQSTRHKELYRIYTGPVAVLVESALPFSILGVVFAVLVGVGNNVFLIFNAIWGSYVAIAPLMIIHRMASGKAWEKDTAQQMSTLQWIELSLELPPPSPTTSDNETVGLDPTDSNVSCIA